jgi:hypothetical protein
VKYQRVKLSCGADGSATDVTIGGGVEAAALRVTIASDSTGVVSVDDNGSTLSIDDGGGAITVDGTVTANLAAGTNNIGDVDVLSVVPGTGATSLGKAEDAAHSSGDVGVMALFVRQDSQADFGADGDYVPGSIDADGALRVAIVSGAGSGGTAAADDADFTDGTTSGTPIMGAYESTPSTVTDGDLGIVGITQNRELKVSVSSGGIAGIADDAAFTPGTSEVLPVGFTFDDTSPDTVNEGDIGAARMSANRNIYVNIRDNAGNERGLNVDASGFIGVTDGGGSLTVDASNLSCNVAQMNGTAVTMGNGASGTGVQRVTIANDSTGVLATVSTVTNITNQGHGADDAAFTPATTRVMVAGFFADETAPDSVDEGDMGAARMSLDRKQYAIAHDETSTIYQNGTARTPVFAAISGSTSGDNTLVAAAGASNKIRVLSLYLVAAGTTTVRFESGAGGTALSGVMSLIANTGFVLPYNPKGWFETAANTLLNMELNAAVQVSGGLSYVVVT